MKKTKLAALAAAITMIMSMSTAVSAEGYITGGYCPDGLEIDPALIMEKNVGDAYEKISRFLMEKRENGDVYDNAAYNTIDRDRTKTVVVGRDEIILNAVRDFVKEQGIDEALVEYVIDPDYDYHVLDDSVPLTRQQMLDNLYQQLLQFDTPQATVWYNSGKNDKIVYTSTEQSDLDRVNAYIEENVSDKSLVTTGLEIPEEQRSAAVLGDANSDSRFDVRDAAFTASMLAEKRADTLPDAADYNRDSLKNIRDAAAMAKALAEK